MAAPMDHHRKKKTCDVRPAYRDGRREKAVKVYTVNQESRYLLVQGVPDIKVTDELIKLFSLYGAIEEYRILENFPVEDFTKAYWVKYAELQAARVAKRKMDDRPFYGGTLHVTYAPEYETVDDTRRKLQERRKDIARRLRKLKQEVTVFEEIPSALDIHDNVDSSTSSPTIGPRKPNLTMQTATDLHQSTSQSREVPPADDVAEIPHNLPAPPKHLPEAEWKSPETSHDQYPRLPTAHATLPRNFNPYPDDHETSHAEILNETNNISRNVTVKDSESTRTDAEMDINAFQHHMRGARPKIRSGHNVINSRTNQRGRSKFLARIAWHKDAQNRCNSTQALVSSVDITVEDCPEDQPISERTPNYEIPAVSERGPTILKTSSFVPRQLRKRKYPHETEQSEFGLAFGGEARDIAKRSEHPRNEFSSGAEIPVAIAGESFDRTVQNIRCHMKNVAEGSGDRLLVARREQEVQEWQATRPAAAAAAPVPTATKRLRI